MDSGGARAARAALALAQPHAAAGAPGSATASAASWSTAPSNWGCWRPTASAATSAAWCSWARRCAAARVRARVAGFRPARRLLGMSAAQTCVQGVAAATGPSLRSSAPSPAPARIGLGQAGDAASADPTTAPSAVAETRLEGATDQLRAARHPHRHVPVGAGGRPGGRLPGARPVQPGVTAGSIRGRGSSRSCPRSRHAATARSSGCPPRASSPAVHTAARRHRR